MEGRHVLNEGDDGLRRVLDGKEGFEGGEDLEAEVVRGHAGRDVEDVGEEEGDEVGFARFFEEGGEDLAPDDLVGEAGEDLPGDIQVRVSPGVRREYRAIEQREASAPTRAP